ncbi:ATP-binding protein [Methanolobus sp. WCC4]|uniref:sensor histidine kinase n=1 Tax=Methanolobus sp. WCC4 TaxID=3125784 RepID=UPI0030F99A6C
MFYDHYVLVPECIREEIEHLIAYDVHLKGIKTAYFMPSKSVIDGKAIIDIIRNLKCDNDILLLCERACPEVSIPEGYCGSLKVNNIGHIYDLFVDNMILKEHENEGTFVIVPGWAAKWEENLQFIDQFDGEPDRPFSDRYSSVLILDTGLHPDLIEKAEEFSAYVDVPFNILDVGLEHFKLAFDNLILQWGIEKKQEQLKLCNRKAASYAMSIDFIKTIADLTDESMAIDSICKLFSTMFAPKNVVYYSFHEEEMDLRYCRSPESEKDAIMQLKDSDANYLVFDTEDGFALKIMTTDDLLGIIEIHGVAFPEYLDEYLSVGYDLAKASGLAISNIRRYHEVFRSREEQVKLSELLRSTNRILSHDIVNDLQIILGALDLLEENNDPTFFSMIRKAANKSVSLIKDVKELDLSSSDREQLVIQDVRHIIDSVISKYNADLSVKGNCLVMVDKAMVSVLDNLVSNAFVHGSASKVDIDIKESGGTCEVTVADNGTGVPDNIKQKVFDEGFKYGSTGHTGFGLFIAKQTIERYNGSIRVEDNMPSGAKFVIELAAAETDVHIVN